MPTVTEQLEDYSIYVILSLRGAEPGFHWAIFVPTSKPQGQVWHAVNQAGGWDLEIKTSPRIPNSISLCLAAKIGTVNSGNWVKLKSTLANVPASGQPSLSTHEPFTCRVWAKDAILALHNAGVIRLTTSIETIEKEAIERAEDNRDEVEHGMGNAFVWNDAGFSAT